MQPLKLTYPSPKPGVHLLVKTDIDQLSLWLDELPSGNMAKYVVEVLEAVSNLNRTDLPITQRIKLLSLLDRAYEKIHNYYRPLMKSGPFKGMHPPEEELKELNRLTLEMSFGYKVAVSAYAAKKTFFRKNLDLAFSANMALHYLGLLLLESYEMYSPIPMHVWSEIYQLYYLTEQKQLSEEKLNVSHINNCLDNVEHSFLRNCLVSLSNPYHLKRGDHWEVYIYLGHWITKAILSEDPEDFHDKNCFVIDLTDDDKPVTLKSLGAEEMHENMRFLLTDSLNINICHQVDEINSSGRSPENCFSNNVIAKKAIHLLQDLLASWEMKHDRSGIRSPSVNRMEVIWSLPNIHHVLSLLDPLIPVEGNRDELIEQARKDVVESRWQTVNNSKGGICIHLPKTKIRTMDVGQLVAIRRWSKEAFTSRSRFWQLGEICWINGSSREGTKVGIQYINGHIQPVDIQAQKGTVLETRFQPAIMLSGDMVDGLSTPTLLAAPGIYIEARSLRMRIGEEVQNIHCRSKVSSNLLVDRFFYQQDFHISNDGKITGDVKKHELEDGTEEVIDMTGTGLFSENYELQGQVSKEEGEKKNLTLDDVIFKKD